ncbi:phthiocerol/phenolphthiocerol synthesis type-I polyketide synthase A [Streptomyces achromogenes]|uniref:Phthiocerol/phenolphthiocerol synthesis type-I polyketide synthase A n=1 Tax=Streptomyces achromogenes TaxID=67255 RepID=A0ABU0PUX9_STRAH|nr:beta-ketoacyl synthase N-terminal-like domain-containing protein [Streptomyces achromogenes]MDQ0682187.1 phthiocerol/phenolphthiocerol synthesis type-I polyketide synthase A [Streptomyces achromogenes]
MRAADEEALRRLITDRVTAWQGGLADAGPAGRPADAPEDLHRAVPMDVPLADLGMSSRDAVVLAGELSRLTGRELPATLLWEAPTAQALVAHLCATAAQHTAARDTAATHAPAAVAAGVPAGYGEPVAVIGVGCRLPGGVHGPAGYWQLLCEGVDTIGRVPADRWRDFAAFPPAEAPTHGGYLDDVAGFDADFFRITPREAAVMDPQQRILLEVVRETLDHAAVPATALAGTATGVFVGVSAAEYGQLTGADAADVDPWAPAGAALSVTAGRLAYALDTRGPSMAVDTACSSSLVALHHACVSLRTGESDTAIAAGVNLLLSPVVGVAFGQAGALAPDGRCKPFSAAADGIGRGEGCAAVLLKRLSDAERDGDRVLAVVRATAVNSDGRSNGLLAPNPAAQQALLTTAYGRAGLVAAHVDYVEAHGTGTPLGDPIEAGALDAVLGAGRDPEQPLLLGSVKGNLGHLEAAAGLAGLVKTVLALHHDLIPPSLHCTRGSAVGEARLRVVTEPEPWPRYGGTATAGVSGFGFSGANAHAVLEEWRPDVLPPPVEEPVARLHLLSDVDAERVRDTAGRLAAWLRTPEGRAARPADVARTLAGRTGRGPVRAAVVAHDGDELADSMGALAQDRPHPCAVTGDRDLVGRGPVWVFSGYGSQWPGMGRRLLAEEPVFAAAVEKLDAQLAGECGFSLHDRLTSEDPLDCLEIAQPVLFGVQVALAETWRAYGVEPAAVIGHSMGEVAAAVCAGALEVPEAARVIAVRARLLGGLRGGAMAVVEVDDAELAALQSDFPGVQVAVHSSPGQKVVTGEGSAVAGLVRRLEEEGRAARVMRVAGAGHSSQVDPLLPELTAALAEVRGRRPQVPVYSTVLDDPRGDCAFDAAHWAANLRRPVRLDRAVAAAAADGHTVFVEISPHPVLAGPIADTVPGALAVGSLRRDADGGAAFLTQVGALYAAGLPLPPPAGRVVDVPAPRWRHTRHWWTDGRPRAPRPAASRPAGHPGPAHGPTAVAAPVTWADPAARVPALATASAQEAEPAGHADTIGEAAPVAEAGGAASVATRLGRHIADVTGHPAARITPSTALADLGLDSLMAVRIRTAVEREFAVALPLRDLLGAATVAEAAERIRRALPTPEDGPDGPSPQRLLRPLRPGGARPPLFLFHAAGGAPDVYRTLAERLGDVRPVLGVERLEEAGTVPEKARRYAEAIDAAHPAGPLLLGGWSFGGFLAQETARLLTDAGRAVPLVVLIDSVRPLLPRPGPARADRVRAHFEGFARHVADVYGVRLRLPYDELAATDDDRERIDLVLRALRAAADVPSAALEHQRASYLDLRIGEAHRPSRYDGRVVLYRATEPAPHTVRDPAYERDDEHLGWDAVCPDLTVVPVPGHHLSLLDPPHVDEIAAHLRQSLAAPGGTAEPH